MGYRSRSRTQAHVCDRQDPQDRGCHFALARERMVLLHSFVKKTQKTPAQDLRLALKRMKEVL
ncbi:hypothetical protein SBA6_750001 [Candidatus Sulfopaludibacter sp. SbA6]|nr:hypothetical protein SBA6_750001 [Candidatus Sulfopaludibacter sp. SbA6]